MKELPEVTPGDLRHFDKEARQLILWAQDHGCRIEVRAEGHARVYSPNGVDTASVSPTSKSRNRTSENNRAGVERIFKKLPPEQRPAKGDRPGRN